MKIDRLLGILMILLQNERVTAPYLAERFEVTRRTIGRDIDALCLAGIPVVTRQGGGGGISIAEGYKLDKSVLTADELSGIVAALKGLGSVSEKSQLERTLEKLGGTGEAVLSLREPIVIDLASHYKGSLTAKIETIKRAVREQKQIEFRYYYEKGEMQRRIEPYFVVFQWSDWYVFGYCLDREDWRLFKLARLWSLRALEAGFSLRDIPPEERDFSARFPDTRKVVALFAPSEKYRLIESYGLDGFSLAEDGRLRAEIGYTNRDHMLRWLLAFGAKAEVVSPQDMAQEIRAIAEEMARR